MLDKRFEELKSALFSWGGDYIEDFLTEWRNCYGKINRT